MRVVAFRATSEQQEKAKCEMRFQEIYILHQLGKELYCCN